MPGRELMTDWVMEALNAQGGRAGIRDVCKHVWMHHEPEIREAGDLMYEWQYEIRWAGDLLRRRGLMRAADDSPKGVWELASAPA
jgi:hypothetical protein